METEAAKRPRSTGKTKIAKRRRMDFVLFFAILILCVFGLITVLSTSYYKLQSKGLNPYSEFVGQFMAFGLGLVVMMLFAFAPFDVFSSKSKIGQSAPVRFVCNLFNYRKYRMRTARLRLIVVLITAAVLVLVAFIGESANGATRWIRIFGISFQPAELAKFILVFVMASFVAASPNNMRTLSGTVVALTYTGLIVCGAILQKNLSMAIILAGIGFSMMLAAGTKKRYMFILIAVAVIGVTLVILLGDEFRMNRIKAALNLLSEEDIAQIVASGQNDPSYQPTQAKYALASGGWFGRGFFGARQNQGFLPLLESDLVFAAIAEQWGFIGTLVIIGLYLFVFLRSFRIGVGCKDSFGRFVAIGISLTFGIQTAINMIVGMGLFTTGQTLPFMSLGGSSLLMFMAAFGIVLNISRDVSQAAVRQNRLTLGEVLHRRKASSRARA